MNKVELVNTVATEIGVTKTNATEIVDTILETIVTTVASGEEVRLHNFGVFKTKTQKGREGIINFGEKKGQTYKTEDKVVPTFDPSSNFKTIVAE